MVMHVDTFTNHLMTMLLTLQMISYALVTFFWVRFGYKGVIGAFVLSLIVTIISLYVLQNNKVVNNAGQQMDINKTLGKEKNIMNTFLIITAISLVIMLYVCHLLSIRYKLDRRMVFAVPFIANIAVFGGLALVTKV